MGGSQSKKFQGQTQNWRRVSADCFTNILTGERIQQTVLTSISKTDHDRVMNELKRRASAPNSNTPRLIYYSHNRAHTPCNAHSFTVFVYTEHLPCTLATLRPPHCLCVSILKACVFLTSQGSWFSLKPNLVFLVQTKNKYQPKVWINSKVGSCEVEDACDEKQMCQSVKRVLADCPLNRSSQFYSLSSIKELSNVCKMLHQNKLPEKKTYNQISNNRNKVKEYDKSYSLNQKNVFMFRGESKNRQMKPQTVRKKQQLVIDNNHQIFKTVIPINNRVMTQQGQFLSQRQNIKCNQIRPQSNTIEVKEANNKQACSPIVYKQIKKNMTINAIMPVKVSVKNERNNEKIIINRESQQNIRLLTVTRGNDRIKTQQSSIQQNKSNLLISPGRPIISFNHTPERRQKQNKLSYYQWSINDGPNPNEVELSQTTQCRNVDLSLNQKPAPRQNKGDMQEYCKKKSAAQSRLTTQISAIKNMQNYNKTLQDEEISFKLEEEQLAQKQINSSIGVGFKTKNIKTNVGTQIEKNVAQNKQKDDVVNVKTIVQMESRSVQTSSYDKINKDERREIKKSSEESQKNYINGNAERKKSQGQYSLQKTMNIIKGIKGVEQKIKVKNNMTEEGQNLNKSKINNESIQQIPSKNSEMENYNFDKYIQKFRKTKNQVYKYQNNVMKKKDLEIIVPDFKETDQNQNRQQIVRSQYLNSKKIQQVKQFLATNYKAEKSCQKQENNRQRENKKRQFGDKNRQKTTKNEDKSQNAGFLLSKKSNRSFEKKIGLKSRDEEKCNQYWDCDPQRRRMSAASRFQAGVKKRLQHLQLQKQLQKEKQFIRLQKLYGNSSKEHEKPVQKKIQNKIASYIQLKSELNRLIDEV